MPPLLRRFPTRATPTIQAPPTSETGGRRKAIHEKDFLYDGAGGLVRTVWHKRNNGVPNATLNSDHLNGDFFQSVISATG